MPKLCVHPRDLLSRKQIIKTLNTRKIHMKKTNYQTQKSHSDLSVKRETIEAIPNKRKDKFSHFGPTFSERKAAGYKW